MAVVVRRLEDKDVRAVFECLHEGKPPPPNLPFQIVPVGSNGLKLSPPSYEFPDGLFVLLRPRSKSKNNQNIPKAPPHLTHLVMREDELPSDTCPWSLSGPQFPQPTAIQQRYCYPKGRLEYSSRKGGALWTMYRKDGKEDLMYRLLHVYFSAKRAVNKGGTTSSTSPVKRTKAFDSTMLSPARGGAGASATLHGILSPLTTHHLKSPAITASTIHSPSSATCDSPLSFSSPSRPLFHLHHSHHPFHHFPPTMGSNTNYVSPFLTTTSTSASRNSTGHRRNSLILRGFQGASPARGSAAVADHSSYDISHDVDDDAGSSVYSLDPFAYDMGMNESVSSDMDWNDDANDQLLSSILFKANSDDAVDVNVSPSTPNSDDRLNEPESHASRLYSMARKLDSVHDTIRDAIITSPAPEQSVMVNVLVHWARNVASDPLATPVMSLRGSLPNRSGNDTHRDHHTMDSYNDATITAV